jgi:hypothetical protein
MEYKPLRPRDALNKAFLKVKPSRPDMERFKTGLSTLLDHVNPAESEEFHKNLLTDFLRKTGYDPGHFINTTGRNDLVIHNGDSAKSPVGVIIEAKNPSNQNEMLRLDRINVKAMQELLLYYLRERITNNNLELRYLIATNVYEWFIFDAQVFEQCFAKDKELVRVFRGFDDGRLAGTNTEFFYKKVAPHYINAALSGIRFTYVNLRDYDKELRDGDPANDAKLIPLFKVLSPEHLLKLPFTNDSNTLDKQFYTELLHIIGLTERKEGGKKLIERKPEGERNIGSLLENAIGQLDSLDKISRMEKPSQFGADAKERLFNVALELAITWTNRVLFLKLLEAQLISYHKGDRNYAFLNLEKVGSYDDLNGLFFEVLARTPGERSVEMKKRFGKVPYLNSSLFEPSAIEHAGLFISQIKDRKLPVHPATVLKDKNGRKRTGELDALEYFFAFLDAYDFTADGAEEIQEDNKTLINASVLGLIFEKINGYKDGSFFTPGFITMYMCRETIRRAVIQKFNQAKGWDCETVEQLADRIDDNAEANRTINSLKICDPAVGSGHFLVSALNELIALKSELGVLCDRDGKRLKNYHVEVVNDELFVTDEDGEFFEYKPKLPESQRVQEMLFHEKQTIIENCLFGVDINPNSVKICRLRLWIELLKNAYYKGLDELETLPNIDINIKCGNSLISRFALDSDLKKALKNSKWNISSYKLAVMSYRNAESKEQKRAMEKLIDDIKGNFEAEIYSNDPRVVKLRKERGKLFELTNQTQMFELSKAEKTAWNKKVKEHTAVIEKLEAEIEAVRSNKIYENAFEWRFEFPEVLDNDGSFVGFDAVIGNPPYVQIQKLSEEIKTGLGNCGYKTFAKSADLYCLFFERGMQILRQNGCLTFISSNKFFRAGYGQGLRQFLNEEKDIRTLIDFGELPVFEEAATDPCILMVVNRKPINHSVNAVVIKETSEFAHLESSQKVKGFQIESSSLNGDVWTLQQSGDMALLGKIQSSGTPLGEYVEEKFYYGIKTGFNEAFVIDRATCDQLIAEDKKSAELIKPWLRGQDICRWYADYQDLYVIFTRQGTDIDKYPAIKRHLIRHREQLEPQPKNWKPKGAEKWPGRKAGPYKWFEIQDNIAYFAEFDQPKIVYPDIAKLMRACYDTRGCLGSNTIYFIPTADKRIFAILNSRLFDWYARNQFQSLGDPWKGGRLRFFSQYMEKVPIPTATPAQQTEIEKRVEKILAQKKENPEVDVSALESEIDQLVYKLYGLTEEEIQIVEVGSSK